VLHVEGFIMSWSKVFIYEAHSFLYD
jgi:hypothetical protein